MGACCSCCEDSDQVMVVDQPHEQPSFGVNVVDDGGVMVVDNAPVAR